MYKLFSQRQLESEGKTPDVYQYGVFSKEFRNQLIYIVTSIMSSDRLQYATDDPYNTVCEMYCREKGLKPLSYYGRTNTKEALEKYIDTCSNEDFLDLLDFLLYVFSYFRDNKIISKDTFNCYIGELNDRLNQHSLGYEFVNDNLIIKTNQHIHKEIIKPAIALLNNEEFKGAEEEYFKAFDYYRDGNNKDAIINANKAFESTMKTICDGMGYEYDRTKNSAKDLIRILEKEKFYPSYLNNFESSIRASLESGAPAIRNKTAGHGQGSEVVDLPDEYVEYTLNLVASNIVFLVKLYNNKEKKK